MSGGVWSQVAAVSIHARARRATRCAATTYDFARLFQSTPARGGRHHQQTSRSAGGEVSIHARARRATPGWRRAAPGGSRFNPRPREAGDSIRSIRPASVECFNPRPREAGDGLVERRFAVDRRFQSTPARGGRPCRRKPHYPSSSRFNPRPREAGDKSPARLTRMRSRFQSTPARGGRPGRPGGDRRPRRRFNPRPREAGDSRRRDARPGSKGFNPRPREAGDSGGTWTRSAGWPLFQSTPARGGRPTPLPEGCTI